MEAGALAGAVLFVLNVLGMVWQPKQVFLPEKEIYTFLQNGLAELLNFIPYRGTTLPILNKGGIYLL